MILPPVFGSLLKSKLGRVVRSEYGQVLAVLLAKETTRKRLVNCFDRTPHSLDVTEAAV